MTLALITAVSIMALAQDEGIEEEPPADEQFRNAYLLLTHADVARDNQQFSLCIDLYRRTLDAYIELANKYPDWEPGVARFRLSYCDNQLKALLEKVKRGKIKLREPSMRPAIPLPVGAGTGEGEAGADYPPRISEAIDMAKQLLLRGKTADARSILLSSLKFSPDDTTIRLLIGVVQCADRKFDDAVFLLENLVEEVSDNADARVVLGTAYFGIGRADDARTQMQKALELDPSHKEAHFNLAQILLYVKPPDLKTAKQHYDKARSLGIKTDSDLDLMLK